MALIFCFAVAARPYVLVVDDIVVFGCHFDTH
jgi:hypothetical protein